MRGLDGGEGHAEAGKAGATLAAWTAYIATTSVVAGERRPAKAGVPGLVGPPGER